MPKETWKIRERFCEHIMTLLLQRGMTMEDVTKAVYFSWSHGASTAMYLPHEVFKDLGESARRAFARFVIEGRIRYEWDKEYGGEPPGEDIDGAIDDLVAFEKTMPMTSVSGDVEWIIGRRSMN